MVFRTPFFLPWFYPQLTWRIPSEEKIIYLTFDDGPVPGPTEYVLDTLNRFNVKATFFCIGDNVRKNPDVFKRILSEGHRTANHTFNHLKGWSTELNTYVQNVRQCEEELNKHSPVRSKLFRPPYGRISRSQIKKLTDFNIIMWDVLTHDYNKTISPQQCLTQSIKATRPGSIVVFHDSLKAERNMSYVLPKYIEHFLSKGFTFGVLPNE
ncbi:MAG TPA: polysaccharide deacetylase family protein [Cyclobacteriaceae bacterium]